MFWNKKNIVTRFLPIYDIVVNDFNCKYVWKCKKEHIYELYKKNMKKKHLEIGPGTGFFLKKYSFSHLYLLDVNPDTLEYSKNQLNNKCDKIYSCKWNIFENKLVIKNIDTVGLTYVLHCVDGSLDSKLQLLYDNLITDKPITIFGATVLNGRNCVDKSQLYILNRFQIFNNHQDHLENAIHFFEKNKLEYQYKIIGNVLLFSFEKKYSCFK